MAAFISKRPTVVFLRHSRKKNILPKCITAVTIIVHLTCIFPYRHIQRDRDLQLLVERAAHSASAEKDQEISSLRGLLAAKNAEIQRFRVELDSILEVLRELHRQGVVLPLDSQTVTSMLR